jgi:hypothetical protein
VSSASRASGAPLARQSTARAHCGFLQTTYVPAPNLAGWYRPPWKWRRWPPSGTRRVVRACLAQAHVRAFAQGTFGSAAVFGGVSLL